MSDAGPSGTPDKARAPPEFDSRVITDAIPAQRGNTAGLCGILRAVEEPNRRLGHFLDTLGRSVTAPASRGFPSGKRPILTETLIVHRLLLLLFAAVLSLPGAAQAQGEVKGKYGDWELRCDTPPGAQAQQCFITQFVTAEDRENVGLSIVVMKTADKQARILRVLAPLGVLLPRGLGLRIDQTDLGTTGFVRCLPNGCVAEVVLEEPLLGKLRAGKGATFIVFQTPEEGIGIPVSLNGFSPGFDALP